MISVSEYTYSQPDCQVAPSAAHKLPSRADAASPRPVATVMADVAGFLLNEVARVIRERTASAIERHGVHPRQLGLLFLLRDAGASSQQQLGERLGMDRTTTMQLVGALEAAELVARDDDPADRRAYRLRLTARGHDVTQTLFETVTAVERQTLKALKASEREQLKLLLRKVLASPQGR